VNTLLFSAHRSFYGDRARRTAPNTRHFPQMPCVTKRQKKSRTELLRRNAALDARGGLDISPSSPPPAEDVHPLQARSGRRENFRSGLFHALGRLPRKEPWPSGVPQALCNESAAEA
jgi:hypothetical protein